MNVFYRRPLCVILCIMLGGFSVFPFLTPIQKALFAASALILLFVSSFLVVKNKKITFLAICSTLLLVSVLLSFFYFDFYADVKERFPERVTVRGRIYDLDIIDEDEGIVRYTIKTSRIGSDDASYKLSFTTSGEIMDEIEVGCVVSLSGKIADYSMDEEVSSYYFSIGIFGAIENVTSLTLEHEGAKPLFYSIQSLRRALTDYSVSVSNEVSGTLLSALLFGERQALLPSVKTDFTNIGISHILALSGMHLTILVLALNKLLMLCRVGKPARLITGISVCVLYTVFTGMSVSIVRAAIMMIIAQTMSLLFKSDDSVTSLFISVFLIVLFAPYTVYSVSLWLSAFATLGVILSLDFIDLLPYKNNIPHRILRFAVASAISSAFALTSTMLISALVFGKFSSISLISTLIFSILIEIIMYLGAITLIVGKIIPISFVLNPIVDLTLDFASWLASLKNAVISTNAATNAFLVITTAIFVVLTLVKIKSKRAILATVITLLCVSTLPMIVYGSVIARDSAVYYTSDFYEDVIVVKDEDNCHVISYGNSYRNNAYDVYEILLEKNVHKVDSYFIFEISENTENELNSLMSKIAVDTVLIPSGAHDELLLERIEALLSKNGARLSLFDENVSYTLGNFSFLPIILKSSENERRDAMYFVTLGSESALFASSGIMTSDNAHFIKSAISSADAVIFGKYGYSYSSKY